MFHPIGVSRCVENKGIMWSNTGTGCAIINRQNGGKR